MESGIFVFSMIGDKAVDRDKGKDTGKQERVPGKARVTQQPRRLTLSRSRLQIRGSPSRDIPSFLRDSNFLPGSSLFRVPKSRGRGRGRFPNLHALHRRERAYTECMADSMSFSPFSK